MEYKINNDSKKFYFGKSEDYSKYRPSYAKYLFEFLKENYGLNLNNTIVELGAGTGKFSKLISSYVNLVYAIEPNEDMLKQGVSYCNGTNVKYINASAEQTTLDNNIADFVFAVQSFHWLDKEKTKVEVKRILKENGFFAIVWNDWEDENNEFSKVYFKYISDWKIKLTNSTYQHKNQKDRESFFKDGKYETYSFIHSKNYSLDMLIGLTKSLSYAPSEKDSCYNEFINGVYEIFNKYESNGFVKFDFHTEIFIGKV